MSMSDQAAGRQELGPEEHRHIWEYNPIYDLFVCRVCMAMRFPLPGEVEMQTASELNIRHDGEESDL